MEHSKLTQEAQRAVDLYAVRLHDLLIAAAQNQRLDPETFLWNSRRAMEAACHLLLTVKVGEPSVSDPSSGDASLDGMLNNLANRKVLTHTRQNAWKIAGQHCNLGVHIQQADKVDYSEAVDRVAYELPRAMEWLALKSPAAPHLSNIDSLARACNEIKVGGRFDREKAVGLDQQDAPTVDADITEEIVDEASAPVSPASVASVPPPPPLPVVVYPDAVLEEQVSEPAPQRNLSLSILLFGSLAAVGAMVVVGVGLWLSGATQSAPSNTAPEVQAQAPTQAVAEIVQPEPVVPVERCPTGMVYVAQMEVQLGQPSVSKAAWPKPNPVAIEPMVVPGFCVDPRPRTRAQISAWAMADSIARTDCLWSETGSDEDPAVCVTRGDAAAYCAAQGEGVRLPSIVEWEVLARVSSAADAKVIPTRDVHEWVDDLSPPAVFNRRKEPCEGPRCNDGIYGKVLSKASTINPDGNSLLSWTRQEPQQGWKNVAFRCASAPLTTP